MWTLIRKDLIFDRRVMAANFAFYLLFLPGYASLFEWVPPTAYAGFAAIVCSLFPLTLVAREDKFKTAALTCSLPVTRDAVVASRYFGGWLVALAAVAVMGAVGYLLPWTGFAQRGGYSAAAFLIAFCLIGLLIAGLFPFTLRFGIAGLIGFLVTTQLLGIVVFLSAVMVGLGRIRTVVEWLTGTVRTLGELLGDGGASVLLVLVVLLLNVASFFLSRWIYRRREF
jgi:ABC-type transport system involved in multi-copper enzyme maturation permease subunit